MTESATPPALKKAKLAAALKRNMARRKAVASKESTDVSTSRVARKGEPRSEGVWGDRPHRRETATHTHNPSQSEGL